MLTAQKREQKTATREGYIRLAALFVILSGVTFVLVNKLTARSPQEFWFWGVAPALVAFLCAWFVLVYLRKSIEEDEAEMQLYGEWLVNETPYNRFIRVWRKYSAYIEPVQRAALEHELPWRFENMTLVEFEADLRRRTGPVPVEN